MLKKIALIVLSVLMGAVFIFSGYAKLSPIEPFEYTFVDMGVSSWRLSPYIARLFISLEFFIGILFVLNLKTKTTCKVSVVVLVFFSLYLIGLIFLTGNKGNCGCFGNYFSMTPLQALLKNAGMLIITGIIYKYHKGLSFTKDNYLFFTLAVVSLGTPHILNYVDLNYSQAYLTVREDYYKLELDTLYKYAKVKNSSPKILEKGKHIVAFMSATCPHCRIAAKKMKIMQEKNPSLPLYLVLNGDENDLKVFFEDTKATNISYCNLNGRGFVYLAGTEMPYIILLNNGTVENSVNYVNLDQEEIEKWISH